MHCVKRLLLNHTCPAVACPARSFHLSTQVHKNVATGIPKTTSDRSKRLTYEQAKKPYEIGIHKSWNSWDTSGLYIEDKDLEKWLPRSSETATENMWIRKFMIGTWQGLLASEVVIKRRANIIILAFLTTQSNQPRQTYFLKGYTEHLLARVLKCNIKLEIQSVADARDKLLFKKI